MEKVLRMLITLCLVSYYGILAAQLPKYFKKCKEEDAECIKDSLHNGLKHMKNGIASLNVPPIDPMKIPEYNISTGEKMFLAKTYYRNVEIYGQSDANLREIVFNLKKNYFKLVLHMPYYLFLCDYTLQGVILGETVSGSGHCDHRITHMVTYTTCKLNRFKKGDEEYLKVVDCDMHFESDHLRWNFQGLSKEMNDKFLEHQKDFFNDMKGRYEDDYAGYVSTIINAFFEHIPASELFLK